jgi:hypothetical protein
MFEINWVNQFDFIITFFFCISKLSILIFYDIFALSHFLVFSISVIGSADVSPNDLRWSPVLHLFVFYFCFSNEWDNL